MITKKIKLPINSFGKKLNLKQISSKKIDTVYDTTDDPYGHDRYIVTNLALIKDGKNWYLAPVDNDSEPSQDGWIRIQ
jgi:hypothetical protein